MSDFEVGNKVKFKTDFYDDAAAQAGTGEITKKVECKSPNCICQQLWEVKILDDGELQGLVLSYSSDELTKID